MISQSYPAVEELKDVGMVGFFLLYPLFFALCMLGAEGRLGKEKGWIHPKAVVLFSTGERQNFLLSSTSKASIEA